MSLMKHTERTCRRPGIGYRWQCVWCFERFVAQDRYVEQNSVQDGEFETLRWHVECGVAMHEDKDFDFEDDPIDFEPRARGKTLAQTKADQQTKGDSVADPTLV